MRLTDLWRRLSLRFAQPRSQRPGRKPKKQTEQEVPRDPHQATSRVTGGVPRPDSSDAHSTTGPDDSDMFVGRVSGQDSGYVGETGAERRAEAERDDGNNPR